MAHSFSRLVVGSWLKRLSRIRARQESIRHFPIALTQCFVPFWCFVAQWTSPVTERHTAIHATRSLLSAVARVERLFYFSKIVYPVVYWTVTSLLTRYGQEGGTTPLSISMSERRGYSTDIFILFVIHFFSFCIYQ